MTKSSGMMKIESESVVSSAFQGDVVYTTSPAVWGDFDVVVEEERESVAGRWWWPVTRTLGDLPDLGGAVLRGRGEEVVVEGVGVDVEDGTLVAGDEGG